MNKKENLIQSMTIVAIGTGILLLIPLFGMLLTNEVNWDAADFIIAGLLIFSVGLAFRLLTKSSGNLIHKIAMALALGSVLFMVWANLAVGLIGAGPNMGNLMYIDVLVVGLVAAILGHFRPEGMPTALFAMAGALVLLTVIALIAGMQHYPGSSVGQIIRVNAFFMELFLVSGFLLRFASNKQPAADRGSGE